MSFPACRQRVHEILVCSCAADVQINITQSSSNASHASLPGDCRQRVREILVCYCVLLNSQKPLTGGCACNNGPACMSAARHSRSWAVSSAPSMLPQPF